MSMLGVSNAVIGAYQHIGRTQKNAASGASFTERAAQTQEASDAEKLENFKKEIWNEINSMPWGANTSNQLIAKSLKVLDITGFTGFTTTNLLLFYYF
nr:hypothetical protein [uncultured Acetatifactor sp.]